ncbi:hypothetical protein C440_09277 [Haloferax mucosum ATCC BAA-1512]|uniref:Uncharacterized protein n=1 Tax=Haloferax mucosum ATCC BAA-1512 TaxID=662479 RepID=M0IHC5_9EURY|nr:hypothetical protein [Haloferax mucosum]ELZ95258.1 hypothetical protein C440_09277 [Haloferax mucosum ATCC BAA-1512]
MVEEGRLPGINKLTEAYLDAWDQFGTNQFTAEGLRNELLRESNEPENVPDENSIYSSLYRAATIGLVTFHGDKKFSIRITPEDNKDVRHEVAVEHIDRLWVEIKDEYDERMSADKQENQDKSVIEYQENRYLRTFVGYNTDIKENLEGYFQAALDLDEHSGVVLESWVSVAEAADKLSNNLCNDEQMEDNGFLYRFKKEGEEITKDEDDERIIRIFLAETRFSD